MARVLALLALVWSACGTAQTPATRSITVTDQAIGAAPTSVAVGLEDVNHEIYGGLYSQMVFGEAFAEPEREKGVSGMWRATGISAAYSLVTDRPFKGGQSQRIARRAAGDWSGVENRGLNRQGLSVLAGRDYEGVIVLRSPQPVAVRVSFQSADGKLVHASQTIGATGRGWQTYPLRLRPAQGDTHARLAIETRTPGAVDIGYVLVQPGAWGRFRGLPVRADVAEKMVEQRLQAIRFGGCANSGCRDVSEYRWKAMIGDPVRRPVTRGFWYPHESNGFGIFEFLQLGEALGIEAVPSLDIDETPGDVRDLLEYLYGAAGTPWGARRAADGHPAPYRQKRIQLGNENAVDDEYHAKFAALAEVIWTRDPTIRLVVGDFTYGEVITDPYAFTGGGKVKSLAAHRRILELAKRFDAQVDFDVHIWTETTKGVQKQIAALDSYAAALRRIAPVGARYKIVVFELNADKHDTTRALGNAYAITALQQRPYIDVISSANALQVDGQNDNGWNQGLIFMNQSRVWVQPPWHVHRMIADAKRATVVRTELRGGDDEWVQAAAFRDSAGTSLNIVNASEKPLPYRLEFGRGAAGARARVTTLAPGRGRAVNTAHNPTNVEPETGSLLLDGRGGADWELAPLSFATIQIDKPITGEDR